MDLRDDEEEDYCSDYCSNNRRSPEMETKTAVLHRNPVKNGLTNPRIKRRLDFDADRRSDEQFGSRDAIFRDLESVLRGVLAVKQEKDRPRKRLHSADEISTPVKVFKQGKDLKPDNDVIRAKRRLNLADIGGSLPQFKKCSKVLGEGQLNAQDFKEYRKRTKQSCLNHMVGKKIQKFNKSMNEELGNGVMDPYFKKCSKDLVTDLANENISENIKKRSRDLVKDRENNENSEKCVRDLVKGRGNKPVGENFEKRGKDLVKDRGNGLISEFFAKCGNDLLKGHGNGPGSQVFEKYSKHLVEGHGNEHVSENFEKCSAVLAEGASASPMSENPVCSESPRVEFRTDPEEISLMIENKGPYPNFTRPTPEECRGIRDQLLDLHGFPKEFASFRPRLNDKVVVAATTRRHLLLLDRKNGAESVKVEDSNGRISCFEKQESETIHSVAPSEMQETMLDSLISTLLSQNTTEANSRRAFASLKARFQSWEEVLKADSKAVEDAIRCGGLAETKASRIRNILDTLLKERGKLSLEHLRNMPVDKIKAELYRFKGVGPKTVACVLMFHLNQDDFPVDTHVYRITKSLGWVPAEANREKAYLHLNSRIPNYLKFDLNCLLITHGKRCRSCAKGERVQQAPDGPCPLVN
jgi:endonuclease-3